MLGNFDTIWLEDIQDSGSLLRRVETKFLNNKKNLDKLIQDFELNYNLLKIWNKTIFTYNTIYFDTKDFKSYYQHQQGKRLRKKVRTRLYEDSNSCFFEIKLKHKTNTIKKRKKIDLTEHGVLDKSMLEFANKYSKELYSELLESNKEASIQTRYKRITLVSKNFEERITFDFDFQFFDLRNEVLNKNKTKLDDLNSSKWEEININHNKNTKWHKNVFEEKNMVIIEVKSIKENSEWNKKLKKKGFLPISYGCSKYCIWLNFLWLVSKRNNFKHVLKAIGKL